MQLTSALSALKICFVTLSRKGPPASPRGLQQGLSPLPLGFCRPMLGPSDRSERPICPDIPPNLALVTKLGPDYPHILAYIGPILEPFSSNLAKKSLLRNVKSKTILENMSLPDKVSLQLVDGLRNSQPAPSTVLIHLCHFVSRCSC